MDENQIAQQIVDAALRVHMALGPGLLELVFQAALAYELEKRVCASFPSRPSR
jgi:GxxExxY protein